MLLPFPLALSLYVLFALFLLLLLPLLDVDELPFCIIALGSRTLVGAGVGSETGLPSAPSKGTISIWPVKSSEVPVSRFIRFSSFTFRIRQHSTAREEVESK